MARERDDEETAAVMAVHRKMLRDLETLPPVDALAALIATVGSTLGVFDADIAEAMLGKMRDGANSSRAKYEAREAAS